MADPRTGVGDTWPSWFKFFDFDAVFGKKFAKITSWHHPRELTPPFGKSWIRHWIISSPYPDSVFIPSRLIGFHSNCLFFFCISTDVNFPSDFSATTFLASTQHCYTSMPGRCEVLARLCSGKVTLFVYNN